MQHFHSSELRIISGNHISFPLSSDLSFLSLIENNDFLITSLLKQNHVLYYILKNGTLKYIFISAPASKSPQNNLFKSIRSNVSVIDPILLKILMEFRYVSDDLGVSDDHVITCECRVLSALALHHLVPCKRIPIRIAHKIRHDL